MFSEISRFFLDNVPVEDVMRMLGEVSDFDRFQASLGINEAAELVARFASEVGLSEVAIEKHVANGCVRWWTFRTPCSWTPTAASFIASAPGLTSLQVDHLVQPFALATYSAATSSDGLRAPLSRFSPKMENHKLTGTVAVVESEHLADRNTIQKLLDAKAVGFISHTGSNKEARGRIELPPECALFAFSLTSEELQSGFQLAERGVTACVNVCIDRTAQMPIVSATLPGSEDREIWMMAHLCHPRPGANDNASGVAALLGVAATLLKAKSKGRLAEKHASVRFLWMPEFVGTAALLHKYTFNSQTSLPEAVINLDMVGEDQTICRSPFIVERSPANIVSPLIPLTEVVVDTVFKNTSNGGGRWHSSPYLGFSDHSLFADSSIEVPTVQLTHWPDAFNHSSADNLDKVSSVEMRRSIAVGATVAFVLAEAPINRTTSAKNWLADWCEKEKQTTRLIAERFANIDRGEWSEGFLRHREDWVAGYLRRPDQLAARSVQSISASQSGVLRRNWNGPFNARAMMESMTEETRQELMSLIRADKMNLAILNNVVIHVNGKYTESEIRERTSYALLRPIKKNVVNTVISGLIEAGWATVSEG